MSCFYKFESDPSNLSFLEYLKSILTFCKNLLKLCWFSNDQLPLQTKRSRFKLIYTWSLTKIWKKGKKRQISKFAFFDFFSKCALFFGLIFHFGGVISHIWGVISRMILKRKLSHRNKKKFLRVICTFLNKNEKETFAYKNKKKVLTLK